jgi:hypothetical protein
MNNRLYTVLILVASALMLASAVIALRTRPHFQQSGEEAEPGSECGILGGGLVEEDEPDAEATESCAAQNSVKSGKTLEERDKEKFDVAEMRNEIEEMIRKFRGTDEERQEVVDECEQGKELIRLFAEFSESSIEMMESEELEKERESFEKEYRAQLEYLRTGRLQRMLKTPEEQEVIGSTIEAAQDFLERIDAALHSAGY